MDFTERLNLYQEGGMLNEDDVADVLAILAMFQNEYGVTLTEENAAAFIAHICAAYGRLKTGEPVDELPECVVAELTGLDTYPESLKVLDCLVGVTHHPLSQVEKDYALLHINNLINTFVQNDQWTKR